MSAQPTRADAVVAGLKDLMLSGELAPGAKLPSESELTQQHGVSRTVVREAVSRLSAEGLVETFRGKGSFVLALPVATPFGLEAAHVRTADDVGAMLEMRLGLEGESAALAAGRATPAERQAVTAALQEFASSERAGAVEADFAFHRSVALASHNRYIVQLLDSLGPMMILMPRTRLGAEHTVADAAHLERVTREHAQVAEAIARGDAEAARSAMRLHLANTLGRVTE